MNKLLCTLLLAWMLAWSFSSLGTPNDFNLGFEQVTDNRPNGWKDFGDTDFDLNIDTKTAQSGKSSAVIEYHGNGEGYKAWAMSIPANFQGKTIKLTGHIKTQNVSSGYAGLWMRIDPSLGFDNMGNRGITGTTDWKKYEITLPFKAGDAQKIVFGGLLTGKGKMWIDNFAVFIDDKPFNQAKPKVLAPAQKDHTFDKGSKISTAQLNTDKTADLALLGKVWGFLKYHHPSIGKGQLNWDYALFRILPKYLATKNDEQRNTLLLQWINSLGLVGPCSPCNPTAQTAFLKPDHTWINQANLGKKLQFTLKYIYNNRHQGTHFYIAIVPRIGNPLFKHEEAYADMPYPDAGFRLLALYRYWNIIYYYFPYKHLIEGSWHNRLTTHLKPMINASNELQYEVAVLKLITEITDAHANIYKGNNAIQASRGENYPPVHVKMVEKQLVVIDYYNPKMAGKVGLKAGDVINTINGQKVSDIIKQREGFYPASNQASRLRNITQEILRDPADSVDISYTRAGKTHNKTLKLYPKTELDYYRGYRAKKDDKSFKMLKDNIGYITLKNIKTTDVTAIKQQFAKTQGIIIDIRNYPAAFMPFSLGPFFTAKKSPFVKFTNGNLNNPGEFTFTQAIDIPGSADAYQGKLILLVNEITQSQAEYTTMAFQAGSNTTVIGGTTAGADGNVSSIYLPGNLETMISGIGVYYPDGSETQVVGIVPDVAVYPTIKGIQQGRDELLDKAIEIIKNPTLKPAVAPVKTPTIAVNYD
ncbi:MAG: S41 family peptidase [Psychrosphaera sp.]|nr:S41 family peptidase [Psychrosphaera sp.]